MSKPASKIRQSLSVALSSRAEVNNPVSAMAPPVREALAVLGYFYLRNGRAGQAVTIFAALDALFPDDRRTVTSLALALVRAGKAERALHVIERLAVLGFVDSAFHLLRAQALSALNRSGESTAAMRAYLTQRSTSPRAPTALAAAI